MDFQKWKSLTGMILLRKKEELFMLVPKLDIYVLQTRNYLMRLSWPPYLLRLWLIEIDGLCEPRYSNHVSERMRTGEDISIHWKPWNSRRPKSLTFAIVDARNSRQHPILGARLIEHVRPDCLIPGFLYTSTHPPIRYPAPNSSDSWARKPRP